MAMCIRQEKREANETRNSSWGRTVKNEADRARNLVGGGSETATTTTI